MQSKSQVIVKFLGRVDCRMAFRIPIKVIYLAPIPLESNHDRQVPAARSLGEG